MGNLENLKIILEKEGLMNREIDLRDKYNSAFANEKVRDCLELETPMISDLTETLQIENDGRLYAVRMDLYSGVQGLKKPVVAGLLLKGLLQGKLPREGIDTLIDAGNMNTGFSLGYYAKKFGMKVFYVMSRFFPEDLSKRLETSGGSGFRVVRAPPNPEVGKEREFYGHLFELMRDRKFKKNKHCLWHAKYGGEVVKPLGKEIAGNLEVNPEYLVVSVGAGSTLECFCAMQEQLKNRPKIIIPEHVDSPIFAKLRPYKMPEGIPKKILESKCMKQFNSNAFRQPPANDIPHPVIGPHFDEPNPFITNMTISKMKNIQHYSNEEWKRMSHYLESHNLAVGNSSAANITVATNLANKGNKVLTVIFEPLRDYYKQN